jgi:tRNA (adenine37-N6)-methyltransferase
MKPAAAWLLRDDAPGEQPSLGARLVVQQIVLAEDLEWGRQQGGLLTWLHKLPEPGDPPLRQVPFLLRSQQGQMGMFAARGPRRINRIGLSLIRILDVTGVAIRFAGVDLLDGTPVIDLKPYVTRFDRPPGEPRCGWYDRVPISDGSTPAQLTPGYRPD